MFSTIKATVLTTLRTPPAWIWTLAFPIMLCTMFIFMFSGFKSSASVSAVPVAIVEDDNWEASEFSQVVETLAGEDGDALLELHEVPSLEAGNQLLDEGKVACVYTADASGVPQVTVGAGSASSDASSTKDINRSIAETIASSYLQSMSLISSIARDNPSALSDPATIKQALRLEATVKRVSLTRSTPDETVRYYYSLLGMAALYASEIAMAAAVDAAGDLSPLGARRCVSGQNRAVTLAGMLLGAWLVSLVFLSVVIAYIRIVAGIDFQGREPLVFAGVVAASFLSIAIGTLMGVLPVRGGKSSRSGLLTVLICGGSLLAGLYGPSAMALADNVARMFPAEAWVNPPKLIAEMFSALYFYSELNPFAARAAACVAFGAVLLLVASVIFRRQRYEHL